MNNQGTVDRDHSKPLASTDASGAEFVREILAGDPTYAINFDRLQFDRTLNKYIIFEFLLCEEAQTVTPYTSHPRRYWHKNKQKFIALWRAAQKLEARLYLVNYAKRGTAHENEILVIEVLDLDENGITNEKVTKTTRDKFATHFREMNARCGSR